MWEINFVKDLFYCYNVRKYKGGIIMDFITSWSLISLILGLAIHVGIFVLIILAILAIIKYLKK
ncbi:hypothetical protein HMPREF1864_01128 [Peptoniphilus sp. DNF00840]|nr:hypothetical protein HMPREF1864_01128 [Peptoniphilus sp. DNF00840]